MRAISLARMPHWKDIAVNDDRALVRAWATRPLCSTYAVLALMAHRLMLRGGDRPHQLALRWALGSLDDGVCEILGYWRQHVGETVTWSHIREDLKFRGVNTVRCELAQWPYELDQPGVGVVVIGREQSSRPVVENTSDTPVRLQPRITSTIEVASRLHSTLASAVRRHEPFACSAAAEEFAGQELQRLDKQLWASLGARPLRSSRRSKLPTAQISV